MTKVEYLEKYFDEKWKYDGCTTWWCDDDKRYVVRTSTCCCDGSCCHSPQYNLYSDNHLDERITFLPRSDDNE